MAPPLFDFSDTLNPPHSISFKSFNTSTLFGRNVKDLIQENTQEIEHDSYPSRDNTDTSDDESNKSDEAEGIETGVPTALSDLSTAHENDIVRIDNQTLTHPIPTAHSLPTSMPVFGQGFTVPRRQFQPKKLGNLDNHLKHVKREQVSDNTSKEVLKEQQQMYMNTPIFTSAVSDLIESQSSINPQNLQLMPQYGLLGIKSQASDPRQESYNHYRESDEERLVYANINVPWSAFICGSQGAGKSHTLSCLLESSLIAENDAGRLPNALTGMVLHYDNHTSSVSTQLCEAAYLCSSGIPVTIFVSPANIWAMKKLYSSLPGLPAGSPQPKVLPLYLTENQLDISRILKLMSIDPSTGSVPLYMEVVTSVLRDMAMEGSNKGAFSYTEFRRRLDLTKWVQGQMLPLNMRLQLLESFLKPSALTKTTRPAAAEEDIWDFRPGTLTIVDLSDPFVSSNDACSLFSICVSIFLEGRATCGRVLALDEAHKFLLQSGEAQVLTESLTSIIRQQRHTGTRVIIATQEPTLAPELIDLANVTFVHRFSSPAWYNVLNQHLAGAKKQDSIEKNSLFETIVTLQTGEALLFSPTALTTIRRRSGMEIAKPLGNDFIKINVRNRLTADGGKSIMASNTQLSITQTTVDVPMHVVAQVPVIRPNHPKFPRPSQSQSPTQQYQVPPRPQVFSSALTGTQTDRIEQEMTRLVRERFATGQRNYKLLQGGDKDGIYRRVEQLCSLPSGTIVNAVDKSSWINLHQRVIKECRAQNGMR